MTIKKYSLIVAIVSLWLLGLSLLAYAQSPSVTPTIQNQTQPDTEVAVLRAQLETMRQYDQRLLETVYWSLGGAGAIVLLVVGLGWYTNFRLHERDRAALKKELLASLSEEARTTAKEAVDRMQVDVKIIQMDLLELEATSWEAKGVYENALKNHVRMIETTRSIGYDRAVARTLEKMQRVLKARVKQFTDLPSEIPKPEFSAQLSLEITEMLENLPKGYSVIADNIRQLLRSQ